MGDAPRRLSIEQCRRALSGASAGLSDAEIELAREQLYALAHALLRGRKPIQPAPFSNIAESIGVDDHADVEERAAIMEFDGRLSRDQAERAALAAHLDRPQ